MCWHISKIPCANPKSPAYTILISSDEEFLGISSKSKFGIFLYKKEGFLLSKAEIWVNISSDWPTIK